MKRCAVRLMKIVLSVIMAILLVGGGETCYAASSTGATPIRVGFFEFEGYHMLAEDGSRSGYGYDILQHLAGYGGFEFTYVGYDKSWREIQEMLARGEIDLLTSVQKTPARMERFDFAENNIGYSATILTVKAGDSRYSDSNYSSWKDMRVGMLVGNSRNKSFADFAAAHDINYVSVFFSDTEEMVNALKAEGEAKTIDAIVTSNLRQIENEWILAHFDTTPFYAIVKKGNTELLSKVNSAIREMDNCEPGIRSKLMNKYYTPTAEAEIPFTAEERAFIKEQSDKTLTAIISPDRAPYSYVENGQFKGIIYDMACELIKKSKLKVRFLEVTNRQQYWHLLENGAIDLRFDSVYDFNQAEQDGYWLTVPYVTLPFGKVFRNGRGVMKTIAVPLNKDMERHYKEGTAFQGMDVTYYPSVHEAVQAVLDGKQDTVYLASDSAVMEVRNDITNRLTCEEIYGDTLSLAVGVKRSSKALLYSIINKAALSLSADKYDAIRQKYALPSEKPFSPVGFFYANPAYVFLGVVALLTFIILAILAVFMAKRRKIALLLLEKEHEQNEIIKDALLAAERADAAKSQFLSRVSHEMRTPLNAIIGFLELSKGAERETMTNYLSSADSAAKQLLAVINDVLDMSAIEAGKLKIAHTSFNLRNILSSLTNIYGTQCKQKGVSFATKIMTPIEDYLVGDELRVNQILMNLLGNAVKFTSKGFVSLTISEVTTDKEIIVLRFEVADSGCGMSSEMQERLFKPFEQENVIKARKYGGSGLGLSIVKNLLGLMGGTIQAKSKLDEGTTFVVDIPFSKHVVGDDVQLAGRVENLHVLAVDDDETERKYISLVLNRIGVRFTCVAGGQEALDELDKATAENDAYNVCLIDCRMPQVDGIQTTSLIRKKYGKDVVVIIASAYDFQETRESAIGAGADLFLSKPVFQSSLFDLFMTLTGGKLAETADEPKKWDFEGRRVLLVEDNALNRIVAEGYLAKFKVVSECAENGKVAVDMFKASKEGYYSAILMDIQMPIMDGFEATKMIRASNHPEAKTIPIIAQTADAFTEDITKSISVGMNAHVAKPIEPSILAKALYKAFFSRR